MNHLRIEEIGDSPGLDPVREELAVDGRLHDSALAHEERKEPRRVTHTIDVDQVFMPPVLAE